MLATAALVILLGSSATTQAPDPVVAQIDTAKLTRSFLLASWQALPKDRRRGYERQGGIRSFIRDLVQQQILAAAAEKRGYLERDAILAILRNTRNAVLAQALIEEEVTDPLLNDQAMLDYYERNKPGFRVAENVKLQMLTVTPYEDGAVANAKRDDAKTEDEARLKIERLRRLLADGDEFATVARDWSEDVTATDGGMLRPLLRGQMAKEIDDAAFSLPIGELSRVLRSMHGFHVLRVHERTPERQLTFDEVRERVASAVMRDRQKEVGPAITALVAKLEAELGVTRDEAALAELADEVAAASAGNDSNGESAPSTTAPASQPATAPTR